MSFDEVVILFCELKPEEFAEAIVKSEILKGDEGSQGCKRRRLEFLSLLLPTSV